MLLKVPFYWLKQPVGSRSCSKIFLCTYVLFSDTFVFPHSKQRNALKELVLDTYLPHLPGTLYLGMGQHTRGYDKKLLSVQILLWAESLDYSGHLNSVVVRGTNGPRS